MVVNAKNEAFDIIWLLGKLIPQQRGIMEDSIIPPQSINGYFESDKRHEWKTFSKKESS